MFCEEIRIKQGLSYILFCPLRILYNSKLILMAISSATNAVVVTRSHCIIEVNTVAAFIFSLEMKNTALQMTMFHLILHVIKIVKLDPSHLESAIKMQE